MFVCTAVTGVAGGIYALNGYVGEGGWPDKFGGYSVDGENNITKDITCMALER